MNSQRPNPNAARLTSPGVAALATSVAASVAFALLARAVGKRKTRWTDWKLRRRVRGRRRDATRRTAAVVAPLGKWWGYGPASLAGAAWIASRRGPRAAAVWPAAAATAAALGPAMDRWLRQREAPPGRRSPTKPVFPSGHALGTSAVALTGAYLTLRAGLARPRVALPIAAAIPLTAGVGRLREDMHWASDIVGGWLAGLAVAAAWVAADEMLLQTKTANGSRRFN
ncbi:MAG TPA: phosphatase PAP2 family protein [Gemmatimonadaceae bacterium]|nr:phosphatase PAP2 family protein [Gemmatimonadaceae bacterium]